MVYVVYVFCVDGLKFWTLASFFFWLSGRYRRSKKRIHLFCRKFVLLFYRVNVSCAAAANCIHGSCRGFHFFGGGPASRERGFGFYFRDQENPEKGCKCDRGRQRVTRMKT